MSSEEPQNLIELAAEAAMDAVREFLAEHNATLCTMYVAIHAHDLPEGELDAVSAAAGTLPEEPSMRARAVLGFLLSEASQTAKVIGLEIKLFPMKKPGRG